LKTQAWQQLLAHVPQSIYLADATIAENIAFGIAPKDINMQRVRLAAQQAQISDFIESRPENYNLRVGERGIQLSGGQRQRIGIARALYKRASIMFFDEATSALDTITEKAVMQSIGSLRGELTIIMVTHRTSTLSVCSRIVELENGLIKEISANE
jgi:ATP-binding cassette subfamily B protein